MALFSESIEEPVPGLVTRTAAWLVYAFLLLPSLVVIPMSFGESKEFEFPPRSLSLELYAQYFQDPNWVQSTVTSFKVACVAAIVSLILGGIASYGIVRKEFLGKRAVTMFMLSPMLVPTIVIALGLYLYLGLARMTGTTIGLIISHCIVCLPYVIVTMTAGLKQVDQNLETAATIMGASSYRVLRHVTIPLLKPTILASGLFAFLISFDEVVISYFMSGVRTQTLPVKMYSTINWEISPVLAAVSTLLTALSLAICMFVASIQKRTQ